MKNKDYCDTKAANEDMIKTCFLRDDKPIVAFRVEAGNENKCDVLDQEPLVAVVALKMNEEYSDKVELPVLFVLDGNALRMRFRMKYSDDRRKTGFCWIYEASSLTETNHPITNAIGCCIGCKN